MNAVHLYVVLKRPSRKALLNISISAWSTRLSSSSSRRMLPVPAGKVCMRIVGTVPVPALCGNAHVTLPLTPFAADESVARTTDPGAFPVQLKVKSCVRSIAAADGLVKFRKGGTVTVTLIVGISVPPEPFPKTNDPPVDGIAPEGGVPE